MTNREERREHSNLYYIFQADQKAHPPPGEKMERIKKIILENFSKT